jgi:hypothetical protein
LTFRRTGSVPDPVGEQGSTPSDAGTNRADGDIEDGGDALVIEVGHVTQDDCHPELVGKSGESPLDDLAVLEGAHRVVGVTIDRIGPTVGFGEARLGSSPSSPQFVECCVGGDAIGPGGESRTSVEAGKSANDCDERVLSSVIGVGSPPENAGAHRV